MAKNPARAHCIGLYLVITEEDSALAIAIWGEQKNSLMDPHLYLWVCLSYHWFTLCLYMWVSSDFLGEGIQGYFSEIREAWLET